MWYIIWLVIAFFAGAYCKPAFTQDTTGLYFSFNILQSKREKIKLYPFN